MEVRTPSVPVWMQEAVSSMPSYGSAVTRDFSYLPPDTTEEIAELANKNAMWFNTDYGWLESYYAPVGTAGLTVRGLKLGTVAGWYPVQGGPRAIVYGVTAGQAITSPATDFTRWNPFGSGMSFRNGGDAHITLSSSGRMITAMPGRYRAVGVMYFPSGTGTGVMSLRAHNAAGSATALVQKPVPLLSGYSQVQEYVVEEVEMTKDSFLLMRSDVGTWTIGGSTIAQMSLKYVGPLLVTA